MPRAAPRTDPATRRKMELGQAVTNLGLPLRMTEKTRRQRRNRSHNNPLRCPGGWGTASAFLFHWITEATMGAVLGDVLGFAAAVAISPLPIIAIILILATPRGRLNGVLFTVGWILGLSALGAVMLAIASPQVPLPTITRPPGWELSSSRWACSSSSSAPGCGTGAREIPRKHGCRNGWAR